MSVFLRHDHTPLWWFTINKVSTIICCSYTMCLTSDILHTVELIELWYPQFPSSYNFLSWLGQKAVPYTRASNTKPCVESPDSKLRRPTRYEASEWLDYYINLLALKSHSVECQVCNNEARLQPYCICSAHNGM